MKTGMNIIVRALFLPIGFLVLIGSSAQAAYFDNAPAYRCEVRITRTLSPGSQGVEVTVLQNFLTRAGLLSAVPNGTYGPATTAAVRSFQSYNTIPATGTVGPMTRDAINERMCDTDLSVLAYGSSYDDGYYGYASGITYVDPYDPFVSVITPPAIPPAVYVSPTSAPVSVYGTGVPASVLPPVTAPQTFSSAGTNIIYSPSIGYTYGITPTPGTLTVHTPSPYAAYREGDTVTVSWSTNNLANASAYTILLENSSTNQSKAATQVSGNSASFVLTRELLDAVCAGACNNTFSGSFRIVVATQVRDIAGNISTMRAAVTPVTIYRPYTNFGTASLTPSKTPVNSGELFKLYVNIPTGSSWNADMYGQYSFKIRALCPSGVTASIAGVPCGEDFTIPFAPTNFQSEIPVIVGNQTWRQSTVAFTLTVSNLSGQVIGTASTTVTVNGVPFSW
jgi:peptidoglycan hydrolase-like protein with peptidoglycan-binding domain